MGLNSPANSCKGNIPEDTGVRPPGERIVLFRLCVWGSTFAELLRRQPNGNFRGMLGPLRPICDKMDEQGQKSWVWLVLSLLALPSLFGGREGAGVLFSLTWGQARWAVRFQHLTPAQISLFLIQCLFSRSFLPQGLGPWSLQSFAYIPNTSGIAITLKKISAIWSFGERMQANRC